MVKVLDHFHKHDYQAKGDTLWCACGDIKSTTANVVPTSHMHKWKQTSQTITRGKDQIGWVERCEVCGELKEFVLSDRDHHNNATGLWVPNR